MENPGSARIHSAAALQRGDLRELDALGAYHPYGPSWLYERLRHIPWPTPTASLECNFRCQCGEMHSVTLKGRDYQAMMWGEPVPLPCGRHLVRRVVE
jgi:hypothetical protein